jgi:hypothetical protein
MASLRKLYIDFETYFNTEDGYTLRSMSMTEYIRDPRFKVFGCGYLYEGEYGWVRGEDMDGFKDLDWKNIEMIAHNVKFDGGIFAWRYGIRPARYFDTQSLSKAILGQNISSHSLKAVAEYLGLPPKGMMETDGLLSLSASQEQALIIYNQRDLECCAGIDEKLRPSFPQNQERALDWTIRTFVNPRLKLDIPLLEKMVVEEQKRRVDIFKHIGIEKEVFSSNKKFAELLESRKIEVPMKESPRVEGKMIPSFALTDPGMVALKESYPDLWEARAAAKSTIVETRGGKLAYVGKTGPFPFDVQFSGAVQTHRYSGGSGAGGNPQNFPRKGDMRKAVCAPAGTKLVVGDFAAIEARLVAWLAKEPALITAYLNDEDVYSTFATEVYGYAINKKDHPEQRKFGKEGILGLGYSMGWAKFQARVKTVLGQVIEEKEARRVVNLYRETYSNVPLLWKNAAGLIPLMIEGNTNCIPFAPFLKTGHECIVLPSGLKIQYPNLRWREETQEWVYDVYKRKYDSEAVKIYGGKIIENICQALAGEICKLAIEECENRGLAIVGQVHDELIAIVREDTLKNEAEQEAIKLMQECMTQTISWWPELRMGAEVHVGRNWQEAK